MSNDTWAASAGPPQEPTHPTADRPSGISSWEGLRSEIRRQSQAWNAYINAAMFRIPSLGTGRLADSAIKLLQEVERAGRRKCVHRLQEVRLPIQDAKDLRAWCLAQLDILDLVRLALPWFEGRCRVGSQLENAYTDAQLIDLAEELFSPAGVSENLRRQLERIRWETHPCAPLWSADCLGCVMRAADFHLRNIPGERWPERPAENADEPSVRRFLDQVIDWCDFQAAVAERTEAWLAALRTAGPGDKNATSPLVKPSHLFARLSDGRYKIRFGMEGDVFPGLEGLRLIEYLLKQPETRVDLLKINLDLYAERTRPEASTSPANWGEMGESVDVRCRNPSSALPADMVERIKEELATREEWRREAEQLGDSEKATKHRIAAETARTYLEHPESFDSAGNEREKIRTKLAKNTANALKALRKAGLNSAADHFHNAINYGEGTWTYHQPSGISWDFSE